MTSLGLLTINGILARTELSHNNYPPYTYLDICEALT